MRGQRQAVENAMAGLSARIKHEGENMNEPYIYAMFDAGGGRIGIVSLCESVAQSLGIKQGDFLTPAEHLNAISENAQYMFKRCELNIAIEGLNRETGLTDEA